jgi:hypothetical protein
MGRAELAKKSTPYILGLIVIALVIFAYAWHRSKEAATAAANAAAATSYSRLSDRLSQLTAAQAAIKAAGLRINDDDKRLSYDMSEASSASQRRHDASDIFAQSDDAQVELADVKDAQNIEGAVEDQFAQYLGTMQSLYGADATRQLRVDVGSGNEATDNAISSWLRAVLEIGDNLKAARAFQSPPYSNSEVVSFYTASNTAGSNASKFRRLSFADAQSLVTRLRSDITKTRARLSQLQGEHPEFAHQPQNL